jgi:hypothetical protein
MEYTQPKPLHKTNLLSVAKDYVENMLIESTGRKALLLDSETLAMVSLIYSKTAIL